jgi:hypothetical protein
MTPDNPRANRDQERPDTVDEEEDPRSGAYDFIDEQAQKRLWLRTVIPLLQLRRSARQSRLKTADDGPTGPSSYPVDGAIFATTVIANPKHLAIFMQLKSRFCRSY